jgi:hypothetical protein
MRVIPLRGNQKTPNNQALVPALHREVVRVSLKLNSSSVNECWVSWEVYKTPTLPLYAKKRISSRSNYVGVRGILLEPSGIRCQPLTP